MVRDYLTKIAHNLDSVTSDSEFEARVIFETVFGRDLQLKLVKGELDREPTAEEIMRIEHSVERRLSGEPLQYIVGEWEFWGLGFYVSPGVLIPRQDTETLVSAALELVKGIVSPKILDLCSGSGCVAISVKLERPDAEVSAVELYPEAYKVLIRNIGCYGGKVAPYNLDALSDAAAGQFSELDLITANPPYLTAEDMRRLQREVEFEPWEALFGGNDGLEFYRELPRVWKNSLKVGGHIAFEIGLGQEQEVDEILESLGYVNIGMYDDMTGRRRVVSAQKPQIIERNGGK